MLILSSFILLIGSAFYYCYFDYQFWTHLDTRSFDHLTTYRTNQIKGWRGRQILIHEQFLSHLKRMNTYARKNHLELIITHSYRIPGEKPDYSVVEAADYSNHSAGYAVDLNIKYQGKHFNSTQVNPRHFNHLPGPIQHFINRIRQDQQLRWGGDFYRPDPVHFDVPLNQISAPRYRKYYKACASDYREAPLKWKSWLAAIGFQISRLFYKGQLLLTPEG